MIQDGHETLLLLLLSPLVGIAILAVLWVLHALKVSRNRVYRATAAMEDPTTSSTSSNQAAKNKLPPRKPSKILDDWQLIDYILAKSNLSGLRLHDIIHYLNDQKAYVRAIEPVVRLDHLLSFLESVVFLETRDTNPCNGWDIVFHGTLHENVPCIIQHGFRVPTKNGHLSRFLCNWGPGIYCSPCGTYSYAYGHKWDDSAAGKMLDPDISVAIFVCAVARGMPYQCTMDRCRKYNGLEEGFDSHLSSCQREWIVFDEKRIVPLCLLWIKRGIPEAYRWPTYERVQPGMGDKQDMVNLKVPQGYRFQNLRERMEYSGSKGYYARKKIWEICHFRGHGNNTN